MIDTPTPPNGDPIVVRPASPGDAAGCAAIYAPIVRDTTISFEFDAPDEAEMRRRITERLLTFPWLVAVRGEDVLGYACASTFRTRPAYQWSAESSVYLAPEARGQGLGRLLYEPLMRILARQNIRTVIAGIALPNDPSVRFHEGLGFRPCGVLHEIGFKFDRWCDLGFWRMDLAAADRPAPFMPYAAIAADVSLLPGARE